MKELSKMLRRCIYLSVRKTCMEKVPIDIPGYWGNLESMETAFIDTLPGCREDPDNVSIDGPGCREDLDKVPIDGPGKYR